MPKDGRSCGLTTSRSTFHLTDDGELTLEGFGEVTEDVLSDICYPSSMT